ncbi:hypothetical protein IU436_25420 [Nocardia farcinica]|uniref:hypothetical protein n=1 Tax=Nocardia farcinica TaxID=37329 RepID=UPI00189308E1|nr:hypothetical protein [Nocardia farcinica]MBF6422033.1 hypothetical protein [Nocardia farcinica]MBF6433690.1 hypothetical protein [Nocardia farcinica]MBF6504692.1 hypothetical protein [Nocardia farcinica]
MSSYLKLYLIGQDGSRWNLTDETEGVLLRPGPQKLIDAPAKTFWLETSTGSHYQGMRFERRDPVFSVQIHARDPLQWADIDSRFRMALGMVGEDTFWMEAHTPYGIRKIAMRLLTEPIAYEQGDHEGMDPWLTHDSTLGISAACERPFWESAPVELKWELTSGTSGTGTLMFENRGDIPVWWYGFVTAPGRWRVPDRSWGQKIYAKPTYPYHRADDDAARMEWLPPLLPGEDTSIDTDPDQPTLIAANGAPVQNRWAGRGLLYPIKPWTPPTPVTVTVEGAQPGAAIKIWIPRQHSRPWGVTLQ